MSDVRRSQETRNEAERLEKNRQKETRTKDQTDKARQKFKQALKKGREPAQATTQQKKRERQPQTLAKRGAQQRATTTKNQRHASRLAADQKTTDATSDGDAFDGLQQERASSLKQRGRAQSSVRGKANEGERASEQQTKSRLGRQSDQTRDRGSDRRTDNRGQRGRAVTQAALKRGEASVATESKQAAQGVQAVAASAVQAIEGRTDQARGPRAAQQVKIPQALIEALAKKIYLGVTTAGEARIDLELGGALLAGVRLSIVTDGTKVKVSIGGDNPEGGRLLAAYHTELAGALRHRGLDLDELSLQDG
jgi:hypothetical protein